MDNTRRQEDNKLGKYIDAYSEWTDAKIKRDKPSLFRVIDAIMPFDVFGDKP